MAVEIGWRQGSGGSDEVWLMDRGQWVCKLFDPGPEHVASHAAYGDITTPGWAFGTPGFWTHYRPAIGAVVRYLKEHVKRRTVRGPIAPYPPRGPSYLFSSQTSATSS
jgi:hypothetical protein